MSHSFEKSNSGDALKIKATNQGIFVPLDYKSEVWSFIRVAYFAAERAMGIASLWVGRIEWIIGQECDGNEGKRL